MKLKITKQWHTDSSYEGVLFLLKDYLSYFLTIPLIHINHPH